MTGRGAGGGITERVEEGDEEKGRPGGATGVGQRRGGGGSREKPGAREGEAKNSSTAMNHKLCKHDKQWCPQ